MDILAAACMAFFLTHLGISGTPLRSFLHGRLGGNAYLGIYSVVSFLTLGLMIYGYSEARLENDFMFVNPSLFILSKVLVFVALQRDSVNFCLILPFRLIIDFSQNLRNQYVRSF